MKSGVLGLGVRRPVGMLMVFLAVVVFGVVSLGKLPFDLLPEIDYPSLTVRTVYPGAAPEDLEERVTERLEDTLATVGGLVRMRSSSRAEISEILLEFEWGSNLAFLVQDVRERLDRVFLPQGVERPLILRYDPSLDPILRLALSGDEDLVRLRDIAEQEVERELEGLSGVAAVKVRGGLEDEIQVRVDPQRLAAFRIPAELIRQRLAEENLNVPGGKLEEGSVEYVVRTLNEFRSLEEIEELPVLLRGSTPIQLGELAEVERTHKDRDVILRVAGEEAVEIDVYREAGANIVEVAQAVKDKLFGPEDADRKEQEEETPGQRRNRDKPVVEKLPSDLSLTLLSDQSRFVRGAIDEVREAAMAGGLLAVLICYFFLRRFAATLIIGIAIPVSILATFGAMYLGGVSLNVMSLGGLALGIGMLVDNTIVVLESITRCREEGDPPMDAAVRGVREVGGAVTASTLTTIAVFAPIVFVEGVAGQIFGDQALTVVASLLLSLAVALFFLPGLAARMQLGKENKGDGARSARLFPRFGENRWVRRLPWPRRAVLWGIVSLVCTAAAWYCFTQKSGLEAALRAEFGEMDKVPEESKAPLAYWGFGGMLLGIPLIWTVGEPLLVLVGRMVGDLLGATMALLRVLLFVPALLLWLLLYVPGFLISRLQGLLDAIYPGFLRSALRAPLVVVALLAALSWSAWLAAGNLGRELLPEVLQGEVTAELFFQAGSPLESTDLLATRLEERLAAIEGVEESVAVSGADRESVSTEEDGPHVARITLRTAGGRDGRETELRVEREIRRILAREPSIERFNVRRPTLLALRAPLEIEVLGEDLGEIGRIARIIEDEVRDLEGLVDLRSSMRLGNPEVLVTLDRQQLAEHGLNLSQIANRLRLAVEGEVSSTFPESDERLDIRVRADLSRMQNVEQLRDLPVNPDAERPLPLGAVADIRTGFGPSEIRHIGSRRAGVLTASLAGFDLGGLTDRLEERLTRVETPPDMLVQVSGQKREMEQALGSLGFALALAVFLVYAVMAAQFESLLQPFLIMFSVPLAFIGAIWALRVAGLPISVVALLGCVVLAGIVVNNAIVLVDRINKNRARGLDVESAIVEAARARLRPILMTTFSTVLGMLPLTGWLKDVPGLGGIGSAEGTELRAPMALVVIAGLLSSTLLTLVVIPVLYRLLALITERETADVRAAS